VRYLHPSNRSKTFVDWRLPENRKESFFRFLDWRLSVSDMDNYVWGNGYADSVRSPTGAPMTPEQRAWYSWLVGITSSPSMAWVFYWHFPNLDRIELSELDRWNRETFARQIFDTDTRYNKGHIVAMVSSLRGWVESRGKGSLLSTLGSYIDESPEASFRRVYEEANGFHKFGRMMSWLFAQALYEVAKLPLAPDTMYVNHPANRSVWNGMCYLYGREKDLTVGDSPPYAGAVPTADDRRFIEGKESELMAEARTRVSNQEFLSFYTLESMVCQFKKLHIGAEFPGANVGGALRPCLRLKKAWPEVDFRDFDDTMNGPKVGDSIRWIRDTKPLNKIFSSTGQFLHLDSKYEDLPDMCAELGFEPGELSGRGGALSDLFDVPSEGFVDEKAIVEKIARYSKDPRRFVAAE